MQTQPRRVTSDLLDRLNHLAESTLSCEEMHTALQQVKFRAQGLRKASPAEYYAVQGICASLSGDVEEVVNAFESGLSEIGWTQFLFHNYATCLDDMGEYELTAQVANRGIAELSDSINALDAASYLALHAGDLRGAAEASKALQEAGLDDSYFAVFCEYFEHLSESPERLDVVRDVIRTTRSFLKVRGPRRMVAMSRFTEGSNGEPHLVLNYAPIEQVTGLRELERSLFAALTESINDDDVFDWITISLARKKTHESVLHA